MYTFGSVSLINTVGRDSDWGYLVGVGWRGGEVYDWTDDADNWFESGL